VENIYYKGNNVYASVGIERYFLWTIFACLLNYFTNGNVISNMSIFIMCLLPLLKKLIYNAFLIFILQNSEHNICKMDQRAYIYSQKYIFINVTENLQTWSQIQYQAEATPACISIVGHGKSASMALSTWNASARGAPHVAFCVTLTASAWLYASSILPIPPILFKPDI